MATTFNVSRTIECWKKHTCSGCGGEYRYKFVRKLTAQGNSERAALDALNKKIDSAVGSEVDKRPCPTCGRVQPDMIGQEKATAHTVTSILALLLAAIPIVLGATYVLGGNLPAFIVAGILGLALLLHFLVAIENLNKNPERNIEKAATFIDDGSMQQVSAGDTTNLAPAPGLIRGGQCVGLTLAFIAVLAAFAPAGYQMMSGFAFNSDTKPDVISPGDKVKLYLPTNIDCVKNNWRSVSLEKAVMNMPKLPGGNINPALNANFDFLPYHPPTVTITNAAELGISSTPLDSSSSQDTWGQEFRVKSSQKHTHPWIWAAATIPNDEKLEGKTIQLKVEMDLLYPKVSGDKFDPHIDNGVTHTFPLTLAKKGESSLYTTIWWGGLVGGAVLMLIAGLVLRASNSALKRSVPPPTVEVDEDEDESPAEEGETPKAE